MTTLSAGSKPSKANTWYQVTGIVYNIYSGASAGYKIHAFTMSEAEADATAPDSVRILSDATEVVVGQNLALKAIVFGPKAAQSVTWSSSDESKATVNSTTGVVTGVAVTSENEPITITATSTADENKKATIQLNIVAISPKDLPSGGLTFDISDVPGNGYKDNKNSSITIDGFSATLDPNSNGNVMKAGSPYKAGTGDTVVGVDCVQIKGNQGTFLSFNTPIAEASKVTIDFFSTYEFVEGEPTGSQKALSQAFGVKRGAASISPSISNASNTGKTQTIGKNTYSIYRYTIDYAASIEDEVLSFTCMTAGAGYIASITII